MTDTTRELQKDLNIKIENVLRKFKDFKISEVLNVITIKNKPLLQWQNDISEICSIQDGEINELRKKYIAVFNKLTEVSLIKSTLLIKFNLSEYNYHAQKDIKIKTILESTKKIASTTIQSVADAEEEVLDAKEVRIGAALMYELFSLFEQQLNRTLNSLKLLINIEISINRNFNGV